MGKYWKPLEHVSSWRKISVGMWDTPRDPSIYGFETLDVTDLLDYLAAVHDVTGIKVSPAAMLVWALSDVFGKHPELNVMIVNGRIQARQSVDAFCQVAIPKSGGASADLSGITIRGADKESILGVAKLLRGKAQKVRAGQDREVERQKKMINTFPGALLKRVVNAVDFLTFNVPFELDRIGVRSDPFGSFMVSSIAGFDLRQGFAPLVPASRCPLVALPGATFEHPMVVDGEVLARTVMQISCTFDHRCYDGLQIGFIVRAIRAYFEHPWDNLPAPESFADHESG